MPIPRFVKRLDPGNLAGHLWLLAGASSCSKGYPVLAFWKNPSRLEMASKYIKGFVDKGSFNKKVPTPAKFYLVFLGMFRVLL